MKLTNLAFWPQKLPQLVANFFPKDVYYVADSANWILYWVSYYLITHLTQQKRLSATTIDDPLKLKNQIIHFISRYAYLNNNTFRQLDPSNHIFVNWFHGDPDDPTPARQRLFDLFFQALEHIDATVVSCQIARQSLVDLQVPESKLITIPLGVDLARFVSGHTSAQLAIRRRLGIPSDAVCLGSFQKDGKGWEEGIKPKLSKGPDIFLEVIANLAPRCSNLWVLLTGPARGYIKRGLERIGVPYVHHFLQSYHDIVPYYHALDLYLISSRDEGGPSAFLESWGTGIPVVSTQVGMPADLIVHRKNGLVAEVEDVDSLVRYSLELLEDKKLHETCRQHGLQQVKRYDWPLIAEQYYQKLYRPLLQ